MSSSLLEIVELADGDIVLRHADDEGEPLVNIRFSDEATSHMPYLRLEIAKVMMQAGIQAFAELTQQVTVDDEDMVSDLIVH